MSSFGHIAGKTRGPPLPPSSSSSSRYTAIRWSDPPPPLPLSRTLSQGRRRFLKVNLPLPPSLPPPPQRRRRQLRSSEGTCEGREEMQAVVLLPIPHIGRQLFFRPLLRASVGTYVVLYLEPAESSCSLSPGDLGRGRNQLVRG